MAADYFLKIGDIKGESKDAAHKDEIEIESFSWGASQTASSTHGTGAGAGKVSLNDFHFVMKINSSSPKIFLACASGQHIPKATLVCRKAGGKQENYLKVDFSDVLISSYQTGGSGGQDIVTEQISLNFTKVNIDYLAQDEKGITKSAGTAGWDVKANVKV